ncbi:calcium-binding protein [Nostoc sp.]|uniref:calcium-binding protein n=1 Tax=Nostoc sp. TaxID=1180 RepID=UPI002FFB9E88
MSQYYLNAFIYYDSNNNGLIESGEQLYSDYASNGRNGQITATLRAGNYYVGIAANTNVNSNYSLQLSATSRPASIASNPGNTLSTAYNIGTLTSTQTIQEFVGNVDTIDYYKFSLTGTNDITLLLSGVSQYYLNAFIYYDSNNNGLIESGEQLYSDYASNGRNGQITATLGAGNYYVGITANTNVNSNYSLQLAATSAPPSIPSNPGNTLSTAYNIGNLTSTQSIKEFVGNVDTVDYYKFSLSNTSNITLLLSGVSQNYVDAAIYYDRNNNGLIESGEKLYSDYAGSGRNGQITATLGAAGNYYVEISQDSKNVNSSYSLQLANNTSTSNQRLTGNALNNTLIGGDGNDQLQGLAGNDTLQGGNGNDILTGGTGDDLLWGGLGDDILNGGAGRDKYLFQSSGVFNTSLGVDYITEFEAGQDQIVLSKTTFNAITNTVGQALTNFAVVSDDQFVNANSARIVFSQSSGSLFYNQDGNALGTGTVFEFARLGNPDITLSSSDFSLIA